MKISSIEIKNFRGIVEFNLNNTFGNYLTILDGENGFGKTTIFDAIEFCLTGWVKRLSYGKDDKNPANPPSTVLKNKDYIKNKTSVSLRFEDGSIITREVPENLPGLMNDNERLSYLVTQGEETLQNLKISTENFQNIFYVPQTDSTELIAGTGKDIKSFLDRIFNTDEEVFFRDQYLNGANSLNGKVKFINSQLIGKRAELEKEFSENKKKLSEEEIKIETVLFIDNPILKEYVWYKNKENKYNKIDLAEENKIGYLTRWKQLLNLYNDRENAFGTYINNFILSNRKLLNTNITNLQKYINYKDFISEKGSDILIDCSQKIQLLDAYLKRLKSLEKGDSDILLKISELFIDSSKFAHTDIYSELIELENKFQALKSQINKKSSIEKVYNDVFATLIGFWNKYQTEKGNLTISISQSKKIDDICPLCTTENVTDKIIEQIEFLKKNAGIQGSESGTTWRLLYSSEFYKRLSDEREKINLRFSFIKESTAFFDGEAYKIFSRLCEKWNVIITQIGLNQNISPEILAENSNNIKIVLDSLEKETVNIDENYSTISYETYIQGFTELFGVKYTRENKLKYMDTITNYEIINNIRYFENERNKLINNEILLLQKKNNEISKNIKLCGNRIAFLNDVLEILDSYKNNLNENIKTHKTKKLRNIYLPVYIFSQRIVKNYNGIGIYLKEDAIQLIEKDGKHSNPLFSLSSGQTEGITLAVMLANNINQSFSEFNTILIDDPIQSLDDLNILSLINLLRYQFPEKQLIISTHDDDFSELIRYKYWRLYGKESQSNINMKERFLLS